MIIKFIRCTNIVINEKAKRMLLAMLIFGENSNFPIYNFTDNSGDFGILYLNIKETHRINNILISFKKINNNLIIYIILKEI
jgi:hypothetical protein